MDADLTEPTAGADSVGDRRATSPSDALIERVRLPVRRALVARYGVEIGEDAAAEAMRIAWERRDDIATMSNPIGYLYRVGQSQARPALRWRRRRATFPATEPAVRAEFDRDDVGPVVAALARLRPEERTAIVLVRCYGYSYAEAAETIGVSEAALTNHLHRGLQRLRSRLGVTP